ncbi:MAG TPA: hypothetical protein VN666_07825 [Nitrospira sp.]|nr:hypothetical protein [Nitrospira sp.]
MSTRRRTIMRTTRIETTFCGSLVLATWLIGCTTPGAVAPSTLPVGEQYAELGTREEASSCGYTILTIPVKNPIPLSEVIDEMVKARGGDALIEVTSYSSQAFYLLGMANCIAVQGKVVKIGR